MVKLYKVFIIFFSFLFISEKAATDTFNINPLFGNGQLYSKEGRTSELQFIVDIFRKKDFFTSTFLSKKDNTQMMGEKYIVKDPKDVLPQERVHIFSKLERISTNAHIFARLFKQCDPEYLFPDKAYYTIFIPYNAALTESMLDTLDKLNRADLCSFLSLFVVPEDVKLTEKMKTRDYRTVAGTSVTVRKDKAYATAFYVGTAEILMPFFLSGDGVTIHIIDKVDYTDAVQMLLDANEEMQEQKTYTETP